MTVKVRKYLKRYCFFLLLLVCNAALFLLDRDLGREAASLSLDNLLEMLSVVPPIFLLLGLMDVWVPKETMMKYMGKESGVRGGVFAFLLGSFSAGPLYASFPVAAAFLRKGVSLRNVFLFIGAWSTTKIPMMLFEITQLGGTFALLHFVLNLAGMILLALVMEKTTSKEDAEAIYAAAAEQTGPENDVPRKS